MFGLYYSAVLEQEVIALLTDKSWVAWMLSFVPM